MLRTSIALCGATLLLAIAAAAPVLADELPVHKAGYWEIKITATVVGGPNMPSAIMHKCVDAASEKKAGELAKRMASKINVQKTANGYIITSTLSGMTTEQHSEIIGNFDSAYTEKATSNGMASTKEVKWLGSCPEGWKPGDVQLPSGARMNILDAAK